MLFVFVKARDGEQEILPVSSFGLLFRVYIPRACDQFLDIPAEYMPNRDVGGRLFSTRPANPTRVEAKPGPPHGLNLFFLTRGSLHGLSRHQPVTGYPRANPRVNTNYIGKIFTYKFCILLTHSFIFTSL